MTQSGIEPATFRFVAQRLNRCANEVPPKVRRKPKMLWITLSPTFPLMNQEYSVTQPSTTRLHHVLATGHLCFCFSFFLFSYRMYVGFSLVLFVFTIFISFDICLSCCSRFNTGSKEASAINYAFTSSRVRSLCYAILLLFISLCRKASLSLSIYTTS